MKVFIEYKVKPEKRELFLKLTKRLAGHYQKFQITNFSVYEGIEQPNLFVEDFIVSDDSLFYLLKNERLEGQLTFWKDLHSCIYGDVENVNIYAFKEVETHSNEERATFENVCR